MVLAAISASVWILAMLLEKQPTTTLPLRPAMTPPSACATSPSDGDFPARNALVESHITASTPSLASASKRFADQASPTTGAASIFQSAVCTMQESGVRIASAQVSGVECVMGIHSTENGPRVSVSPGSISISGDGNTPPRLRVLWRSTAAAKGVA